MLHLVQPGRSYTPESLVFMGAAFDRVCQSVSEGMNGSANAKRKLALIILRLVDRGEADPERLAAIAVRAWTALTVVESDGAGQLHFYQGKAPPKRRLCENERHR